MDFTLFLTLFHIIGVAIGVGGATVSDVLFFRALKDKRISKDELALLHTLGLMLWVGLGILFASGVGFVLTQFIATGTSSYLGATWFLAKMSIIAVLFLNALVMHWYIFPFMQSNIDKKLNYATMRPHLALFATTGVVSITSWYSALTLGVTRGLDFSYGLIINLYLVILVFGVLVAYVLLSIAVFKRPAKDTADSPTSTTKPWLVVLLSTILGIVMVMGSWYWVKTQSQSSDTPTDSATATTTLM